MPQSPDSNQITHRTRSSKRKLTNKEEIFTLISLILGVLACAATWLALPQIQNFLTSSKPTIQPTLSVEQQAIESQVRYVLADSQLSGTIEYYRQFIDQPAIAEAVHRWDSGVRVTNIDEFERLMIGQEGWKVVYLGTVLLIDGMDVELTSDE